LLPVFHSSFLSLNTLSRSHPFPLLGRLGITVPSPHPHRLHLLQLLLCVTCSINSRGFKPISYIITQRRHWTLGFSSLFPCFLVSSSTFCLFLSVSEEPVSKLTRNAWTAYTRPSRVKSQDSRQ
jgi:hypothetical protein